VFGDVLGDVLGVVLVPAFGVEITCGTEDPVQRSTSAEEVINAANCPTTPAPRASANGQDNSSPSSTLENSAKTGSSWVVHSEMCL
jgi:hypothetical protein